MLVEQRRGQADLLRRAAHLDREAERLELALHRMGHLHHHVAGDGLLAADRLAIVQDRRGGDARRQQRSEEHTSELQSLMRISYAVFCLKKKKYNNMTMSSD